MADFTWDSCEDYTNVGTLDGLYQHTPIATGTRLRPLEATFLGYILAPTPPTSMRVEAVLDGFTGHLGPPEIRPKFAY